MAPRANWKGFLRLSLVTCPVALFPATSDAEKISFNQINKKTGHRIRYLRVDCPSSDDLRLVRRFVKGGSGSSGLEFKRPATDAASVA